MKIKINSKTHDIKENSNVSDAIRELEINPKGIAIAVNGKVVPKSEYETHTLYHDDDIVIIKAFYGG